MLYQEHAPHPGLKKHIKCYWTMAISASMTPVEGQRFLTEGLEMSFNLADAIEFVPGDASRAAVRRNNTCGPMTRPMRIRPIGHMEVLGVCFRPGGAYPFFSHPACELVNACADLTDFLGSKGSGIVHGIQDGCTTTAERIDLLDGYFLRRLDINQDVDDGMTAVLDAIAAHRGQVKIGRLAQWAGIGRRQLERRFKQRVGMSPKQLCRSMRFKNVFRHLAASPAGNWCSTAADCGYYDQSHLIREFRHYTGASPAAFFAQPSAKDDFFMGNF